MKKFVFMLFAALALGLVPINVSACACCAEKDEYFIRMAKPSDYELGILGKLSFDEAAELYLTEAGFDNIKGLKSIAKDFEVTEWAQSQDYFKLQNSLNAKTWSFNFNTKTLKSGTLALPLPVEMLTFKADIHDTPEENEISLYKEWRFKGIVRSGNGFFASDIVGPTSYFLVLQGRGNGCDNAKDFTHWRLEITGKNAGYAFLGKMNVR